MHDDGIEVKFVNALGRGTDGHDKSSVSSGHEPTFLHHGGNFLLVVGLGAKAYKTLLQMCTVEQVPFKKSAS